jgi:hypothetical protein
MIERQQASIKLLVPHQQLAKPIEPAMGHLYSPALCLLFGVTVEFGGFLTMAFDVGNVAMLFNDLQGGLARSITMASSTACS